MRYALSRWIALTLYLDDGRLEIDNNTEERAIRPLALGPRTISSPAPIPAVSAPPPSTP